MAVFPSDPFLVVTNITPFAALAPYIEAEAASFRTVTDSIKAGSKSAMLPTKPLIKINGLFFSTAEISGSDENELTPLI